MKQKRVLLVDDSQLVLDTILIGLQDEALEMTTSTSGEDAVSILKKRAFDLVVTDLQMGGMDGLQVLKETKELQPDTGVIILTGVGDLSSAIDALRLGADDYLLKPYDIQELILRMNACFEKKDLQKKIRIYENILPICSYCKTIRDDTGKEFGKGDWLSLEEYLDRKGNVKLSHGCCPACYEREMQKLKE